VISLCFAYLWFSCDILVFCAVDCPTMRFFFNIGVQVSVLTDFSALTLLGIMHSPVNIKSVTHSVCELH